MHELVQAMVAFAKEAVETYCRVLIEFMGHDGGFILGSGCEVPMTAKPENVEALIRAVRR